jgi:hypothetical protein
MTTARSGIPRFSGGFKTFSVSTSTNREKGTEDRLLVYSQGSRAVVVEYLWLKLLWDELTREEMKLFIMLPEVLNSEIKIGALRALLIKPKRFIRNKLIESDRIEVSPTRELYQGYKRLDVEIQQISRKLPKVPKFSGWIRSSSAKDNKSSRGPSFLEPLAIIEYEYDEIIFDWYYYLTVEDNNLLTQ